ncbi:3-hydroxyacyl-CoA dehydrogenase family protein [Microbacterium sp. HJ5]
MIETTAIVGAGYMGGGIAQVLALAGRRVVLADANAELAAAGRDRIVREAEGHARRRIVPADAPGVIAERVTAAPSIEEAVADVDFIEEAVPEVPEIKRETLARIGASARADALIGTNTSTISIGSLAGAVDRPERFLGVHFSNPAPFVPGVEVIPHQRTDASAVDRVVEMLAECGKVGVPIADVTGFVLNRLQYALFGEAARLVEEGVASPEAIDLIARTTFGFRLPFFGPFAIADIAGLDVYDFCYRSLGAAYPDRFSAPDVLREKVESGELGMKSGRGFLATAPESAPELAAYRDQAYAALSALLHRLGDPPVTY